MSNYGDYIHLCDYTCAKCGSDSSMRVEVCAAAHNPELLDVVVHCDPDEDGCGTSWNAFLDRSSLHPIEVGK